MTSQSPRIYTYKITFEEVPYYYYGVKKEDYYNQEYWGSPYTHKWCWDFYTPKKQILQFFDFTDEGWLEAQEVEKRLIRPFYNTDKWCLNENVSGKISLEVCRKVGLRHKENSTGIFSLTPEEKSELGRKNGLKSYENGTGLFSQTPEEWSENSRKIGLRHKENGTGLFSLTDEQKSELARRNGLQHKENGTSIFSFTPEQRSELGRKTCTQKWECLETGFTTNPGNLTHYQKKRGIDTSKRRRIA